MARTWYLNGEEMAAQKLVLVSGSKTAHAAGRMVIRTGEAFDGTPLLAYGDEVVISYQEDGDEPVIFFQGKCVTVPRYASAAREGMDYEIEDAWAEMERTPYQESWGYGILAEEGENVHLRQERQVAKAIFGRDATGARITVGEQLENAIGYAAAAGIDIQIGTVPSGEVPLPSEVTNVTVAEIISMCLRYHPDWMPWIDHSTEPPTFHVTPVADMEAISYKLDGTDPVSGFDIVDRQDLLPAAVRIVYEYAGEANLDGEAEIFRRAAIDKYPSGGPDAGPGVMSSTQPLEGMTMQAQKSPVQALTIPASAEAAGAVAWVKANYPHLANVPSAEIEVTAVTREMLAEDATMPPPVNPRAVRLDASSDADDYPRQLLRGTIEDWMRVRVGKMRVSPTVVAAAGASAETLAAIAKGTPPVTVTATNARTKIYFAPSQYIAPEDVPTGIAQSVYEAIHAGVRWQGYIEISTGEIPVGNLVGAKLNLTDSAVAAWATMNAPIHSMTWDVQSGKARISFGPVPYLAPDDFLEMQRILRALPVRWYSSEERTGEKFGAKDYPSAAGDSVGGFDHPQTVFDPSSGGGGVVEGAFYRIIAGESATYLQGGTVSGAEGTETAANIQVTDGDGPLHAAGHHMWVKATVAAIPSDGVMMSGVTVTGATVGYGATVPDDVLPTLTDAGEKYVSLGVFTDATFLPSGLGNIQISFCPPNTLTADRDA
jgi:hypothetical protein